MPKSKFISRKEANFTCRMSRPENHAKVRSMVQLLLYLCIFCVLSCAESYGQGVGFVQCFNTEDGLADRNVYHTERDGSGRFWIVSEKGIQIFDGKSFEDVGYPSSLHPGDITKLEALKNGHLFLRTSRGVAFLIDAIKENFIPLREEDRYEILHGELFITSLEDGLLILSSKGTNRLDKYSYSSDILPKALDAFDDNTLITLGENGEVHLHTSAKEISSMTGVSELIGKVGKKYMVLRDSMFYLLDRSGKYQRHEDHKSPDFVYARDHQGNALVLYSHLHNRFNVAELFTADTVIDYSHRIIKVSHDAINDIVSEDFRQKVLIGTHTGLCYYNLLEPYDHVLFDPSKEVGEWGETIRWIVYRPVDSTYYFAEEAKGVYSYRLGSKPRRIKYIDNPESPYDGNRYAHYSHKHDLLLSSSFDTKIAQGYLNVYDFVNDLERIEIDMVIYTMIPLTEDELLICGRRGEHQILVFDLQQRRITQRHAIHEVKKGLVDLHIDGDQVLLGGLEGLYRGKISKQADRLEFSNFSKICEDRTLDFLAMDSSLLVGTEKGILRLNSDGSIDRIDEDSGLPSSSVHTLVHYSDSLIGMSTLQGWVAMNHQYEYQRVITREEELTSNELNRSALCISPDGDILLGTINGLNVLPASSMRAESIPSRLLIKEVRFKQNNVLSSLYPQGDSVIQIPHNAKEIVVIFHEYDYYRSPILSRAAYQYKVHVNGKPTILSNNTIPLGNPKPGRFTVQWQPLDHFASSVCTSRIHIQKLHWIQQFWPYLVTSFALLLAMYLFYNQNKKKKKQKEYLRNRENQYRLNEVRLTALRSHMNPHFIFNALGSIQYYIQTHETDLADDYLSKFARLMRRYLDHSQKNSVSLHEELLLLKLYTDLEKMRFENQFEVNYHIEEGIQTEDVFVPTMLLQPFIENAIKHGLDSRKDGKGLLEIKIVKSALGLYCTIQDNGIGIENSKNKKKLHKSSGMNLIREKIDILNETGLFDVSYEVTTPSLDPSYPGTLVTLKINEINHD